MPVMNETADNRTISQAAMVAGEVLLPGASELIAGEIGSGVGHFVAAGLAAAVLAPSMPVLAIAAAIGLRVNSYMLATKRRSLYKVASDRMSRTVAREADEGEHIMHAGRKAEPLHPGDQGRANI